MNTHKRRRTERLLYRYSRTLRGVSEELAYRFNKTLDALIKLSRNYRDVFPPE